MILCESPLLETNGVVVVWAGENVRAWITWCWCGFQLCIFWGIVLKVKFNFGQPFLHKHSTLRGALLRQDERPLAVTL